MSGLSIVIGPTLEPVTLVEARAQTRIDGSLQDGELASFLLAARQHVEKFTGRALISQTFEVKFDYCWPYCDGRELLLPKPPLLSVTSISYVDTTGAMQVLSASAYQVTERYGCGRIVPAYGQAWPSARWQPDAITVRFVAGYGTNPGDVPEPIRRAILLLVAHFDANREAINAGQTVTEIPFGVRTLLAPYVAEF